MKTIFITLFEGVESKNILHTDLFITLHEDPEVRTVFFVKNKERQEYHEREFSGPRIAYEIAPSGPARGYDLFFSRLKFLLLNTKTAAVRRRMVCARKDTPLSWVRYWSGSLLQRMLAHPAVVRAARLLDMALVKDAAYADFFERHRPDLLLCANLFDDGEANLLREAKKRGVRSVGFINSWDKPTARSVMRLLPEKTVVFNEIIGRDMVLHHGVRERDIFVGGPPHYDEYFSGVRKPREELFREIGCDPGRKLIVYSPLGSAFTAADWEWIDFLSGMRAEGLWGPDTEFFVRFPPYDTIDVRQIERRPRLAYEYPGKRFSSRRLTEWDMTRKETAHLADLLFHASLLICHASSISVDAAVFDRPVINVNFEIGGRELMPGLQGRLYAMTHYAKALESGGIRLVESKEDLAVWVRRYLEDPSYDRAGRARLVKEQCAFFDGKSGERIGKFILDQF